MARLQRGERVEHYETVRQHKDGHRIDISLTVSPLVAADGTILGASAVARDISERKQLEADRQRAAAALRESEEKYGRSLPPSARASAFWRCSWTTGSAHRPALSGGEPGV